MANLDLASLLTQSSYGGLPKAQALAVLQSLSNQLYQNPGSATNIRGQLEDMFGTDIAGKVIQDAVPTIGNNSVTVQDGAAAPTKTTVNDLLQQQQTNSAQNKPTYNNVLDSGLNPIPSVNPELNPNNTALNAPTTGGSAANPLYGDPTADVNNILAEAERQKVLAGDTLNQQNTSRQKYLTDLSALLQKQQSEQLTTELPGMYEDLNSRGLLRSSALGDKLSLRQEDLAKITSNELAKQGLAYQDQYTNGLGDIENNYLSSRNSALQRRFSIEDLNTNIKASKEMGFALQPQQQSSGKGSATLSTAVNGALIGSKFGPAGAIIGAGAGAGAGSASSGK